MAMKTRGLDPLGRVRDALSRVLSAAERLAVATERLEAAYARSRGPIHPNLFYVPSASTTGRELDDEWNDPEPDSKRRPRKNAIEAVVTLRAKVDEAIESVATVPDLMDSQAESVDRRWTTRTIGELRRLRGAILRGHGRDVLPSVLPMIRAGVPVALREASKDVAQRMEEVKSAILAGVGRPPSRTAEAYQSADDLICELNELATEYAREYGPAAEEPDSWQRIGPKYAEAYWSWLGLHHRMTNEVRLQARSVHGLNCDPVQVNGCEPECSVIEVVERLGFRLRDVLYRHHDHPGKVPLGQSWDEFVADLGDEPDRILWLEVQQAWNRQSPERAREAIRLLRFDGLDFNDLHVRFTRERDAVLLAEPPGRSDMGRPGSETEVRARRTTDVRKPIDRSAAEQADRAVGAGGGGAQKLQIGGAKDDAAHRAEEPTPPASVPLTSDHESILSVLAKAQMKCKHVHWVASNGPIRNRETVGRLLRQLEGFGLVNRPHGKRKGYALTDAGRLRLPGATPT